MKSNIFVPNKIKVGFQERSDTYTKKLAYVIYYDQKGTLRKEGSWNSWRNKEIHDLDFDNIPTSGFVLNKKVGDYKSDWNHRQAYVRVYDPRNFEFEITIENLLYILENTNSIKGKGLEGQFIYAWDGKELILLPIDSPDYKEISEFNKIIHTNNYIKTKDLILGATYRTKDNNEYIYMGRFDYWKVESERVEKPRSNERWHTEYDYVYHDINKGKHYYFVKETTTWNNKPSLSMLILKSLGDKFIECLSSECIDNYAELFDRLECTKSYSPYDKTKDEYIPYTFEEFEKKFTEKDWEYVYGLDSKKELYIKKEWHELNKFYCEDRKTWQYIIRNGTLKEIFDHIKPIYKKEYLKNGKLYKED